MPNDTCQIQYACKPVWSCDFRSCSRTVVIWDRMENHII
jgi:hypothetical protein